MPQDNKQRPLSSVIKTDMAADEGAGSLVDELRRLLAEGVGTFALTTVAAGAEVIAAVTSEVSRTARVVAPGMLVMAMIYAIGNISGAHFNPAVTMAFALRRSFPWRRVPGYWIVQMLGAVLAALLLRTLFGPVQDLGATIPQYGSGTALVMEMILTFFLITVILGTASRHGKIGPQGALAVGATIALDGLIGSPISGASMNPARSLGPALVSRSLEDVWIYIVGPIVGGVLAVLFTWMVHGSRQPGEVEAATGDGAS